MAGPPSWSGTAIRSFDQEQPPVPDSFNPNSSQDNPTWSKIRSLEGPKQLPLYSAGTQTRTIGDQPTAITSIGGGQPPSFEAVGHGQETSFYQVGTGIRDIGSQQAPGLYDNVGQVLAPSVGALARRGVFSEAGGGDADYDKPPTQSDFRPLVASNPGAPPAAAAANVSFAQGDFIEMSFNGANFSRVFPGAFVKKEEQN